jgi:hypothetical protein
MTVTELPHQTPAALPARSGGREHAPAQGRWLPTRAGILNLWRYYDEVFEFHRGRLLLRGPNGTRKSKALELLLPYLFDANLRPNRLSTFGSGERTMHWNLMGEGASVVTRVGYVWLEFRAGVESAEPSWFCCGSRLQASAHTTTVHADYFSTSQRIGLPGGLALANQAGQPLTRAALAEAIGSAGTVHPSASDYRTAVRTTLAATLPSTARAFPAARRPARTRPLAIWRCDPPGPRDAGRCPEAGCGSGQVEQSVIGSRPAIATAGRCTQLPSTRSNAGGPTPRTPTWTPSPARRLVSTALRAGFHQPPTALRAHRNRAGGLEIQPGGDKRAAPAPKR